jgi:hypothetical protein
VESGLRVFLFGHALLEKALQPYVGMTAHAVLLTIEDDFLNADGERQVEAIDALLAEAIPRISTARGLAPLPVLGVPGWWPHNEHSGFYDDVAYFRPGRTGTPR